MKLYFTAIVLKPGLREQIKVLKEEVKTKFGARHALKLPAHITLNPPFKLLEEQESVLVSSLQAFVQRQKPFNVRLDGFDSFPPRVIFVKVVKHQPIVRLHNELVQTIDHLPDMDKDKKSSSVHPHVSIASRDLREEDFADAWAEFKSRDFEASFPVESIILFKHNGKSWELQREFFFGLTDL